MSYVIKEGKYKSITGEIKQSLFDTRRPALPYIFKGNFIELTIENNNPSEDKQLLNAIKNLSLVKNENKEFIEYLNSVNQNNIVNNNIIHTFSNYVNFNQYKKTPFFCNILNNKNYFRPEQIEQIINPVSNFPIKNLYRVIDQNSFYYKLAGIMTVDGMLDFQAPLIVADDEGKYTCIDINFYVELKVSSTQNPLAFESKKNLNTIIIKKNYLKKISNDSLLDEITQELKNIIQETSDELNPQEINNIIEDQIPEEYNSVNETIDNFIEEDTDNLNWEDNIIEDNDNTQEDDNLINLYDNLNTIEDEPVQMIASFKQETETEKRQEIPIDIKNKYNLIQQNFKTFLNFNQLKHINLTKKDIENILQLSSVYSDVTPVNISFAYFNAFYRPFDKITKIQKPLYLNFLNEKDMKNLMNKILLFIQGSSNEVNLKDKLDKEFYNPEKKTKLFIEKPPNTQTINIIFNSFLKNSINATEEEKILVAYFYDIYKDSEFQQFMPEQIKKFDNKNLQAMFILLGVMYYIPSSLKNTNFIKKIKPYEPFISALYKKLFNISHDKIRNLANFNRLNSLGNKILIPLIEPRKIENEFDYNNLSSLILPEDIYQLNDKSQPLLQVLNYLYSKNYPEKTMQKLSVYLSTLLPNPFNIDSNILLNFISKHLTNKLKPSTTNYASINKLYNSFINISSAPINKEIYINILVKLQFTIIDKQIQNYSFKSEEEIENQTENNLLNIDIKPEILDLNIFELCFSNDILKSLNDLMQNIAVIDKNFDKDVNEKSLSIFQNVNVNELYVLFITINKHIYCSKENFIFLLKQTNFVIDNGFILNLKYKISYFEKLAIIPFYYRRKHFLITRPFIYDLHQKYIKEYNLLFEVSNDVDNEEYELSQSDIDKKNSNQLSYKNLSHFENMFYVLSSFETDKILTFLNYSESDFVLMLSYYLFENDEEIAYIESELKAKRFPSNGKNNDRLNEQAKSQILHIYNKISSNKTKNKNILSAFNLDFEKKYISETMDFLQELKKYNIFLENKYTEQLNNDEYIYNKEQTMSKKDKLLKSEDMIDIIKEENKIMSSQSTLSKNQKRILKNTSTQTTKLYSSKTLLFLEYINDLNPLTIESNKVFLNTTQYDELMNNPEIFNFINNILSINFLQNIYSYNLVIELFEKLPSKNYFDFYYLDTKLKNILIKPDEDYINNNIKILAYLAKLPNIEVEHFLNVISLYTSLPVEAIKNIKIHNYEDWYIYYTSNFTESNIYRLVFLYKFIKENIIISIPYSYINTFEYYKQLAINYSIEITDKTNTTSDIIEQTVEITNKIMSNMPEENNKEIIVNILTIIFKKLNTSNLLNYNFDFLIFLVMYYKEYINFNYYFYETINVDNINQLLTKNLFVKLFTPSYAPNLNDPANFNTWAETLQNNNSTVQTLFEKSLILVKFVTIKEIYNLFTVDEKYMYMSMPISNNKNNSIESQIKNYMLFLFIMNEDKELKTELNFYLEAINLNFENANISQIEIYDIVFSSYKLFLSYYSDNIQRKKISSLDVFYLETEKFNLFYNHDQYNLNNALSSFLFDSLKLTDITMPVVLYHIDKLFPSSTKELVIAKEKFINQIKTKYNVEITYNENFFLNYIEKIIETNSEDSTKRIFQINSFLWSIKNKLTKNHIIQLLPLDDNLYYFTITHSSEIEYFESIITYSSSIMNVEQLFDFTQIVKKPNNYPTLKENLNLNLQEKEIQQLNLNLNTLIKLYQNVYSINLVSTTEEYKKITQDLSDNKNDEVPLWAISLFLEQKIKYDNYNIILYTTYDKEEWKKYIKFYNITFNVLKKIIKLENQQNLDIIFTKSLFLIRTIHSMKPSILNAFLEYIKTINIPFRTKRIKN